MPLARSALNNQTRKPDSLARNLATNSAGYLLTLVLAFVTFPVMIMNLGVSRYGEWMLVLEVTGYYAYLDVGIRAATTYFTARCLAEGRQRDLDEAASTAVWSLAAIALLLSLTGFLLARLFPLVFDVSRLNLVEVGRAIVIMSIAIGVSLPADAMGSILNGSKRLDVSNMIDLTGLTGASIAMLVAVLSRRGLVTLALIMLTTKCLILAAKYAAVRRLLPALALSPRFWRRNSLRQLARFGVPSLLLNLGFLASTRTDLIVVGIFAGVRMVPRFGIPRGMLDYATTGVRSITEAFCAPLTHLHAQPRIRSWDGPVELFLKGARISGIVVFLLTAYMAVFGKSFLRIWQGPEFISGYPSRRADIVLLILVLAYLPRLLQSMSTQFFFATNRLNFLAWIQAMEAVMKIALSLALAPRWSLAGVAFANLIPIFIFQGLVIPFWLFKTFPLPPRRYFVQAIGRPLSAGVVAFIVSALLTQWVDPANWFTFLSEAGVALVAGVIAAFVFALDRGEVRGAWERIVETGSNPVAQE
jgi:O-antigen/teichoic acid export membrane protein